MHKEYLLLALFFLSNILGAQPTFQWLYPFGSSYMDIGRVVTTDESGNIYSAGTFSSTVDFDNGTGITEFDSNGSTGKFLLKLKADGSFLWAKQLYTQTAPVSIIYNSNTLYLLSANCIQKFSADGDLLWSKTFFSTTSIRFSGFSIDKKENFYITGEFSGTADFDESENTDTITALGNSDAFILKLDQNGNYVWAKNFGSHAESAYGDEYSSQVICDHNDNVIFSGTFCLTVDFDPGIHERNLTSESLADCFVLSLDSSGNFNWVYQIGGPSFQYGGKLALDGENNIYSCMSYLGRVRIDKLNAGNKVWTRTFGHIGSWGIYHISIDQEDNIITCGAHVDTSDYDPGPGECTLKSNMYGDIFIHDMDSEGQFKFAGLIGGPTNDEGYGITLSNDGSFIVTGFFMGKADFNPGVDTLYYSAEKGRQGFIAKYNRSDLTQVYSQTKPSKSNPFFYPIPNYGDQLYCKDCPEGVLRIYDENGSCIYEGKSTSINSTSFKHNITKPGVYFMEISSREGRSSSKIVILR
jgi:hypothetical protein